MAKRHLLLVAPTSDLRGGGDLSLFELIKDASNRNYETTVAVPKAGQFAKKLQEAGSNVIITGYSLWHPAYPPALSGYQNLKATRKLASFIQKRGVDLVISNTLQVPWGAVAAAYANTRHVWITCEFPTFGSEYLKDHYDFVSQYSDVVLANSQRLAQTLSSDYGLKNVDYFYSYVNPNSQRLNSEVSEQRIVCIGNINSNKGQLTLVKAIHQLKKSGQLNKKTLLIGECSKHDPYAMDLQRYIRDNDLQNNVRVLGYKEAPFSLVGRNDIFVQPSESESIGRAIVQAMHMELVCIGADIPGTSEAFELGHGILYKNRNHKDLARKIAQTISNFETERIKATQTPAKLDITQSLKACHENFYKNIERVLRKPSLNPQHSLRHLEPYSIEPMVMMRKEIATQKQKINDLDDKLNAVLNSKVWTYATKIRKLIYRR